MLLNIIRSHIRQKNSLINKDRCNIRIANGRRGELFTNIRLGIIIVETSKHVERNSFFHCDYLDHEGFFLIFG